MPLSVYTDMKSKDIRFTNAIFCLTLISTGVLKCIRLRFVSSDAQITHQFLSWGAKKITFGWKFALTSIAELDR